MKKALTARLYLGFSLAVILVVGLGITSYQTLTRQARSQEWVRHSYQVTDELKSLQIAMIELSGARRAFRLTGKDSFLLVYKTTAPALFGEINKLKSLVTDNPGEESRVDSLFDAFRDLVGFWETSRTDGAITDAYKTQITLQEERQIGTIRNAINKIAGEEHRLLTIREADDNAVNGQALAVLCSGILLILVIVFVLIYVIFNEFKNRSLAEADLQKSVDGIRALVEEADKRNWQLTGITRITDGMHAAYSLSGLINNIIRNLADYIGLPAAVFYLFDEDKQVLLVKGSSGATVKEDVPFKPGQLPGGLPLVKEVKIIKQVPENFWEIRSALGIAKPVEIAIIGLYIGRELKGVIELASFSGFSREQVDLLRSVSDNMAVSLHAAQTRERVIRLLEQVQEQKETLENQQEELRLSNEELTRQAETLQASEEELKVQEEELRHINAELEDKNEAVETARQALQDKAKELDAVSRYKSEFLANMSHELRTPLNSILILAKLLADNKQQNLTEKQAEYAGIIHKSGNELLNLINDILDLSKIESGKIEITAERVTVQNIIDDLAPQFNVVAEERKLSFIKLADKDVPSFIITDKPKLEQVIKNLLSNAFKFTPPYGTVTLQFSLAKTSDKFYSKIPVSAANHMAISVTDTGIGISTEKQRLIFEAFQQADGSTSRRYGGTGLGLSISKELVRLLGGEIHLNSQVGVGSTFTIIMPQQLQVLPGDKTKEAVNTAPASIQTQQIIKDDRDLVDIGDRVMLIIEDDVKFASILQDFARERQYKTIIALSGDEGLMYASKYVPTAIILDIQLPVLDGWGVLKAIKKNNKLKHIPVHIISVTDNPLGQAEGALAYLKKPVDNQGLEQAFDAINNYLASNIKKILFFSAGNLNNQDLQELLRSNRITAQCKFVKTIGNALALLKEEHFDCIIVDIGVNISDGIDQLGHLNETGALAETPLIIYLDEDISQEDEWRLKKFSSVVIRHSDHATQRLMDELELFLYKLQQSQKSPLLSTPPVNVDDLLAGKKVLIVDDDMRNVFALSVALEEHKMRVCTANDGKEALEVLAKNKDIAVVLMDIMMPEMDGYEALRRIRGTMKLDKLPVIALTAKAMQGDYEKSIEAGASDYIAKPVDINKVLSVIRVWLSK
jgi:signal transduction histidine kinase/CheY-like chemotaxis protein/CHASE3 domain sensor protein